jgi:hypothetical protein
MVKTLTTAYRVIAICLWGKGASVSKSGQYIVIRHRGTVILIGVGS